MQALPADGKPAFAQMLGHVYRGEPVEQFLLLVAQALAFEAGIDTGVEQHLVDRLSAPFNASGWCLRRRSSTACRMIESRTGFGLKSATFSTLEPRIVSR